MTKIVKKYEFAADGKANIHTQNEEGIHIFDVWVPQTESVAANILVRNFKLATQKAFDHARMTFDSDDYCFEFTTQEELARGKYSSVPNPFTGVLRGGGGVRTVFTLRKPCTHLKTSWPNSATLDQFIALLLAFPNDTEPFVNIHLYMSWWGGGKSQRAFLVFTKGREMLGDSFVLFPGTINAITVNVKEGHTSGENFYGVEVSSPKP